MATGVQNAWSTTAATNATADSAVNWAEGQAPSTVNNSARAVMALVKKLILDWQGGLVTGGSSTAYTLTTNETLTLADGVSVTCRMSVTSGAAPTLNVDSMGAVAIQTAQGTAVPLGALIAGGIYTFTYYASSAAWIVHGLPGAGSKYIGEVFDFAGTAAPALSLLCYGQAISRTTYAALFAVISTTYGTGDGSTTFNVPDLRGRVVAGQDDMGGTSANRLTNPASTVGGIDGDVLGGTGGAETHVITEAQLDPHTHTANVTDPGHAHTSNAGTVRTAQVDEPDFDFPRFTAGTATSSATTGISVTNQDTGSGAAHNNVQPTLILNKCIFAGA